LHIKTGLTSSWPPLIQTTIRYTGTVFTFNEKSANTQQVTLT